MGVDFAGDRRLLCAAVLHAVGEAFDRAGVHALLAEVLAGDVELGLLARAAERDVGVLVVGMPGAGEDARGLP